MDKSMFRKITLFAWLLALISLGTMSATQLMEVKTRNNGVSLTELGILGILGIMTVWIAVLGYRDATKRVKTLAISVAVLFFTAMQAYFLRIAGNEALIPILKTAQLLAGFFSVWLLFKQYLHSCPQLAPNSTLHPARYLIILASFVLFWQIVLGSWVTVNSAGLVCSDFPVCKSKLLQQADYQTGLDFFHGVVHHYAGKLPFDARVAVHWLHRLGAAITFFLLSFVMLSATSEHYSKPIRKAGLVLSALLLVQITLGIMTVKMSSPLPIVLAHNLVAALLMLPLIAINFYSHYYVGEPVVMDDPLAQELGDSVYLRLKSQLQKTRNGLGNVLTRLPLTQKTISEDLLEEIEESLLLADIGIEATTEIIDKLTDNLERHELNDSTALFAALKQDLLAMLAPCSVPLQIPNQDTPFVILVVGINGAGKTTTIGKLAKKLQNQGHSVMLAAGDTFRAAAVEQLQVWGKRNNIPVVAQHTGADSASVIFDGLQSAKAKNIDVLIADTAGRLHTKSNLMEELKKIKRIMSKLDAAAPHEVLLVLDAGTGQNALSQAKLFNESVALTGLALTKLDGTAKGGIIFALAKQLHIPIRYIGVGEGIDDLQEFNAQNFVEALFVNE